MERLKKHKFAILSSGQANDVEDFFDQIIKPQFFHKEAITELHRTIMNYVKNDDATFFLRLYGSFPKESYSLLRRGFLTEYPDKTRMVFCDNTFSMFFAGLKIAGFPISESQLSDYLNRKELICSFGMTSEEKQLSYYSPQNAIRVSLNSKGWYQAHIKPVGYEYEELSTRNLRDLFPNPDRNEWNEDRIRRAPDNLTDEEKKVLTAHFVRLIHPFNSFLVPKPNHVEYSGKRIGEEPEVIEYVRNYIKKSFPNEYEEFEEITRKISFTNLPPAIKNIKWHEKPYEKKDQKKTKTVVKTEKKLKNDVIYNSNADEKEIEKSDNNLEKWLKSIGKDVFTQILFPAIQQNINVTAEELADENEKYASFTANSQKSRLSSAKSIFKNGFESEALQIIIDSRRIDPEISEIAKEHLKNLN